MNTVLHGLALALLGISWLVPHHLPPWWAFHTEAPAFAATVLIALLLAFKNAPLRVRTVAWVLGGLAAFAWVQWAFGLISYAGDAWIVACYLGVFLFAWHWVDGLEGDAAPSRLLTQLQVLLVVVGLCVALQTMAQTLAVHTAFGDWVLEPLPGGRARGNLGQPNQAATTLVLAAAAATGLFATRYLSSWSLGAVLTLLALALTTTQSRTGVLSGTCLGLLVYWFGRGSRLPCVYRLGALAWVGSLWGLAWLYAASPSGVSGGALGVGDLAEQGTRPVLWAQFGLAVIERPWFGWGWLQVPAAQQFGALSVPSIEQANFTHNFVIDTLVMLGLPIGGGLLVTFAVWLWMRWRTVRGSRHLVWTYALLLPLGVHSLLEYPHAYAYFVVVAGAIFGVIDASSPAQVQPSGVLMGRLSLVALTGVWIGLVATITYEYIVAEEDYRVNRFENRRIGDVSADYVVPRLYLLTQTSELLRAMRLRAAPQMTEEDLSMLLRTSKRYTWAPLLFRTALACALNERPEDAYDRLLVIKQLFEPSVYSEAVYSLRLLGQEKYPVLLAQPVP